MHTPIWEVTLEANKTVRISGPNIESPNTVAFTAKFVELGGLERRCTVDLGPLKDWLLQNPGKTWKDYFKAYMLDLYNRFYAAKDAVDKIAAELK